ncbi:MAG: nucleotide-binding protein [Candidatus Aenigmarchaeota archaeon]|nr:nucleotide-binding protein [Candidatus Aenigmarchaeota archaeon]
MKRIILDTNFLTIPHQFNIDIFEEIDRIMEEDYELMTLDRVVKELKRLSKLKGKDATAAKVALELIKKKNIKIINTDEKKVDNAIIKLADENTIVATNDRVLRRNIKDKNLKVLYLRSKKRLEMG